MNQQVQGMETGLTGERKTVTECRQQREHGISEQEQTNNLYRFFVFVFVVFCLVFTTGYLHIRQASLQLSHATVPLIFLICFSNKIIINFAWAALGP
jgi:hypothetical protein